MKTIQEEIQILRSMVAELLTEVRELRSEISTRRDKATSHIDEFVSAIDSEKWSRLYGVMTFPEVCVALEIENTRSSQIYVGAELTKRGVPKKRNQRSRVYDFGNERTAEIDAVVSSIKQNYSFLRGKRTMTEALRILNMDDTPANEILLSKSARKLRVDLHESMNIFFF